MRGFTECLAEKPGKNWVASLGALGLRMASKPEILIPAID
jgi:hypothetical protein